MADPVAVVERRERVRVGRLAASRRVGFDVPRDETDETRFDGAVVHDASLSNGAMSASHVESRTVTKPSVIASGIATNANGRGHRLTTPSALTMTANGKASSNRPSTTGRT